MYSLIRIIIGCVLGGCAVLRTKNKPINKVVQYVGSMLISLVLIVTLLFLPLENLAITFDSPKDAYEYYKGGKSNIKLVVDGEKCDLIVDCNGDTEAYLIIPKNAYGWKVGIGLDTKRIVQNVSNGIITYVYQYKNTNDYFITVFDVTGKEINISDNCKSEFYSLEKHNDFLSKTYITYYAHISNFNPQYKLLVNGNNLELSR